MKPNKSLFFPILSIIVLITSCKQSPEDPAISFRSREERIKGDWILEEQALDGQTMKETEYSNIELSLNSIYYEMKTTTSDGVITTDNGTWEVDEKDKRKLILDSYTNFGEPNVEYYLYKVSHKELWLRQLNNIICDRPNEFKFKQK